MAKPIIIDGECETSRAVIAGIRMMLVTSNAPTIFTVTNMANESMDKNKNSKIFVLIPRAHATSLLKIVSISLW